jgi:hypothetical protein
MGLNLQRFAQAIGAHDVTNRGRCVANGIGMAAFDMDRLGIEEGEEVLPGYPVTADGKGTGNFRVICDADHDAETETESEELVVVGRAMETVEPGEDVRIELGDT